MSYGTLWKVSSHTQGPCLSLLLINAGGANFFPTNGSSFQTATSIPATASESSFTAILALLPRLHLIPKLRPVKHTPRSPFSCLPAHALQSGPAYFADFYFSLLALHHPPSWTFIFDVQLLVEGQLSSPWQDGLSSPTLSLCSLSSFIHLYHSSAQTTSFWWRPQTGQPRSHSLQLPRPQSRTEVFRGQGVPKPGKDRQVLAKLEMHRECRLI